LTSAGNPAPARIKLDQVRELYTVNWLTGRSHADRELNYRVTVFNGEGEVGSIDVDLVQNGPQLASVDPTRYIAIVRGQQLTLRFRIQHPTARTRVTINEVESQAGVPGDWIEFHNSARVPLSLGGHIVKDGCSSGPHRCQTSTMRGWPLRRNQSARAA